MLKKDIPNNKKNSHVPKVINPSEHSGVEDKLFVTKTPINEENEKFEGFCIDLLQQISKIVGFEYTIELVPDGKYGVYDLETGEWNGIVRQLMDKVKI